MKIQIVSRSLFVLLALPACEPEAESSTADLENEAAQSRAGAVQTSVYRVDVGAPIDGTTGRRWLENYRRTTGNEPGSYTIASSTLRRLLAMPESVGISMQFGTDDAGGLHIFPSAVDNAGRILAVTVASADTRRFIGQYTGVVKSHFFGRNTFMRLLDEEHCEAVRATLALDDGLAPQLLLSDAGQKEPRVYEDASYPCLSSCPHDEEF